MAVQLTLIDIGSGYQGSDIQTNFTAIEDEFDKVLYRDGSLTVTDTIDMNSQRLVNLPAPTSSTEPLRKDDQFTSDEAQAFATDAETAKDAAESALETFQGIFYGAQASDPATDPNGNAVGEGDLYFNTTDNILKAYDGSSWVAAANEHFPFVFDNVTADEDELNLLTFAEFTSSQLNSLLKNVTSEEFDMGITNKLGGGTNIAHLERSGNQVTYHQEVMSFSTDVSTYTYDNPLPANYRPETGAYFVTFVGENSGYLEVQRVYVQTNGNVTVDCMRADTGAAVNTSGIAAFSVSFKAATDIA